MPAVAAALLSVLGLGGCGSAARQPPADPIRVLVYNIHAGKDAEGVWNLDRVAAIVRDAGVDVALLQEVDRGTERSGAEDQPAVLRDLSGLDAVFGRTLDYQGGEYGIAVLSAVPVVDRAITPMAVDPPQERAGGSYEPRGILRATLEMPGGTPLHVLNTHLDASGADHYRIQEVAQLVRLADSLRAAGGAVMLGGDLNAEPDSEVIGVLTAAGWRDAWAECGAGDGLTFPAAAPVKRIDYLFVSPGLRCTAARVLDSTASDHRGLLVELRAIGSDDP